ncbi:hypothetical protein STEG23_003798, partial [Scotinomys teguina]
MARKAGQWEEEEEAGRGGEEETPARHEEEDVGVTNMFIGIHIIPVTNIRCGSIGSYGHKPISFSFCFVPIQSLVHSKFYSVAFHTTNSFLFFQGSRDLLDTTKGLYRPKILDDPYDPYCFEDINLPIFLPLLLWIPISPDTTERAPHPHLNSIHQSPRASKINS